MPTLSRELRKSLERAIVEAREVAEEAAEKALEMLAVGEAESHRTMTPEQKALRSRLRAHGKQLGDSRNETKGSQGIDHLLSECAYEQWHRMLFARFLADNQLLLEPESGVAVAIDEVKELARERGRDWVELSGEFAVRMLPQVFRQGDPVLEVQFAPEDRRKLDELLASLPADVFTASDSLGWTYQFWQTERKNEVNASGDKIGADELPAVTQLFTEDYMVDFLLDNTLGAWHAGKVLAENPKLGEDAQSEDELREAVALPGIAWEYLRFIKGEDGRWSPAAGAFDGWPTAAKDLKCLDPCMGSGHFVVAMFERLVAARKAEENLDEAAAVAAVIRDNVFGLEIDPRCTQIGAFNLALAAWRRVGYCTLPAMNLACSGIAPNAREIDWLAIAGDNQKLRRGMARLYQLFNDAPVLGSLLNPRVGEGDLLVATFHELQPLLERALAREATNEIAQEMAVAARGLAKAAEILASQFTLVATNVPYLGIRKQSDVLREYCERLHNSGRHDLATAFIDRILEYCAESGTVAVVSPQTWLLMQSYKTFREQLLRGDTWAVLASLGSGAFETISGEVVKVGLLVLHRSHPAENSTFLGLDASVEPSAQAKALFLRKGGGLVVQQECQFNNPDSRVIIEVSRGSASLSDYAQSLAGVQNGDSPRFLRYFWELMSHGERWAFQQSAVLRVAEYGGLDQVIDYDLQNGHLRADATWRRDALHDSDQRGRPFLGKRGVTVSRMAKLPCSLYLGTLYDQASAVIVPHDPQHLPAIWALCSSEEYVRAVRALDSKLGVTSATLVKVPFDLIYWQQVAAKKYPKGLPDPFSNDPAQWLFNGHPSEAEKSLHVAAARLLDYRWPRQTGSAFPDCPALGSDGLESLGDGDGIVCLSAIKGEGPAAERLQGVLVRAYGNDWNATRQEGLLAQVNAGSASLEDWLCNKFFEQHCSLFEQRPFIWHVWDGLDDGFSSLINYHRLTAPEGGGHRTLEKLTFSYLGDWITRQKAEQRAGKEGADDKIAAAIHLQNELKFILAGEPPYDLFVRWKPLHEQAVGWEPDINDGVRMNIRPFMAAKTLRGKSIFRKAPKIKWEKDRGKEPARAQREFPWFWRWDEETVDFQGGSDFDGNRWNDLHYSNSAKTEARDRNKEKGR